MFWCCEPELCRRKADSHLELDGVHNGFHRGSVAIWLRPVICWRPRSPQSPAPRLSALCPQGTHERSGGGQPPHPGRTKVKKKKKEFLIFVILLFHVLVWSVDICLVIISLGRTPLEAQNLTRKPEITTEKKNQQCYINNWNSLQS